MLTKILAGLLMGFLAGASAKAHVSGEKSEFSSKGFASAAVISSIAFMLYTFIAYPVAFGFAAVGELVVGALLAGFLTQQGRQVATGMLPVGLILAWIMAVA